MTVHLQPTFVLLGDGQDDFGTLLPKPRLQVSSHCRHVYLNVQPADASVLLYDVRQPTMLPQFAVCLDL